MGALFGGGGPKPPPPPPPPANPPTYASQISGGPMQSTNPFFSGIGQSILTSPLGTTQERSSSRKSLLGQ